MLNLTNYIDRTFDLAAYRGAVPAGQVLLKQSLADETSSGEICVGIQKLAQKFILALLTVKGSVRYRENAGTSLMRKLQQGRIRTETDMAAAFALAEQEVAEQLLGEELEDEPEDEKYRSATLTSINVTPGSIQIGVRLQSRADSVNILVPIPIVI